jgi:hypothetical protein
VRNDPSLAMSYTPMSKAAVLAAERMPAVTRGMMGVSCVGVSIGR